MPIQIPLCAGKNGEVDSPGPEALLIRATDTDREREARVALIRAAWHAAYSSIYTAEEIDGIFDGALSMHGSWLPRRSGPAGTFVAEDAERGLAGLVSLGLLEPGIGEVAALYIRPDWQRRGLGRRLWEYGLSRLRDRGLAGVEVWTLARAEAQSFYRAVGCTGCGEGTVTIRDHVEPALGFSRGL